MQQFEYIPSRIIRQIVFLLILGILGWFIYREMEFMLGAFLGSIALYSLMRKPMFKLWINYKWPKWAAALLLMLVSFVIIVLPISWVVDFLIDEVAGHVKDTSQIEANVRKIDQFLIEKYQLNILSEDNMDKLPGMVAGFAGKLVSTTLNTVANVFIMYFILWFMLMKVGSMEKWIIRHIPLRPKNRDKLMRESNQVVISNAIGIPVLGAVQGLVATIGYLLFDVDKPVLWGIITGISSVIPFVGTMAAWVPLVILKFAGGDSSGGIWLAIWGLVAIGGSDNVFRFVLQKYMADIHPLITVFGVIVGLGLFGFLGLIFGPLLISLFLLLIRIYYDEFVDHAEDEIPAVPAQVPISDAAMAAEVNDTLAT